MMKHAIVAIEDRRFYDHRGVDVRGIMRALWEDVRNKEAVQGGSTITQQYVKNAYAGNERSIGRKVREAALAWQLENQWRDKDRILTAYLNTIYFGNGAYGIQQAARIYFGHGAKQLSVAEAALLAAIPQDPSHYDPVANPEEARARRNLVLRAMYDQGYITRGRPRRGARRAAAASRRRPPAWNAEPARAVLHELRHRAARRPARRRDGLRRRPAREDDDRPRAAGARAQGDREAPRRPGRAASRARRARPDARGTSWRWSAAGTTARASSTSPSRDSGNRAPRSSRSCSRRRSRRASAPRRP